MVGSDTYETTYATLCLFPPSDQVCNYLGLYSSLFVVVWLHKWVHAEYIINYIFILSILPSFYPGTCGHRRWPHGAVRAGEEPEWGVGRGGRCWSRTRSSQGQMEGQGEGWSCGWERRRASTVVVLFLLWGRICWSTHKVLVTMPNLYGVVGLMGWTAACNIIWRP